MWIIPRVPLSNCSMSFGTLRILAGISVLVQTIWFDPDLTECLPTAFSYLRGRLTTYELLLCCLPLAGIVIFIGIWKSQSWAWTMAMILSLFIMFQLLVYWLAGHFTPISFFQITAVLICCVGFAGAAREQVIRRLDVFAILLSVVIAVPIVYIRSMYFRSISIDYDWPIPRWLEIRDHSNFVGTKAVFLWWALYWALMVSRSGVSAVFRIRSGGYK